jgi:DNA-binding NtrC family response regulator
MPNDTIPVQDGADAGAKTAGQSANISLHGFSCVFLTSSFSAVAAASRMVESAQIHIHHSATLDEAKARLHATASRVLLTDDAFERGNWRDALRMTALLPLRTALVLVSRIADVRLWISALEHGAYDLVLEPFRADDLRRILENAYFHAIRSTTPREISFRSRICDGRP